jgi:3-oxoacyl-[acyl-carrier protein] reductase
MMIKNRAVIVTGATRGIGRAIALDLAEKGADIAFNYRTSTEEASSLQKEIQDKGVRALSFQADVTDFTRVKEMVAEVKREFGRLDVLVNNAGIARDKSLAMMSEKDWADVIDTNLTGIFNCSKAVIVPFMKQKSGVIINMTSVSGLVGRASQVNYASAKAGIIGFTKSLAKEVSAYNILVNAVAPGGIETDMLEALSEKHKTQMISEIPLGRFGTVQEIAGVVSFLASDAASYITGHVIPVDGGLAI